MRAKKQLGQHFLADQRAVSRIVTALDPQEGEPLLEIGPGRGALTGRLIEHAGRIAAVELDDQLGDRLCDRFPPDRLLLLRGSILEVSLLSVAKRLGQPAAVRLTVVGNLPYNISKPVAMKLIRERAHVERAVLMFQREVALRLIAAPGSRAYGPMSVLAGEFYRIRRLFDLPGSAFRPAPRVKSSVTLWERREGPSLDADEESRLRACLAVCFKGRRKTLRNNLRDVLAPLAAVDQLLEQLAVEGSQRAEALAPDVFRALARRVDFRKLL